MDCRREITLLWATHTTWKKVEIVKKIPAAVKVTDYEVLVSTDGENFTSVGKKDHWYENEMRIRHPVWSRQTSRT